MANKIIVESCPGLKLLNNPQGHVYRLEDCDQVSWHSLGEFKRIHSSSEVDTTNSHHQCPECYLGWLLTMSKDEDGSIPASRFAKVKSLFEGEVSFQRVNFSTVSQSVAAILNIEIKSQ